MRNVGLPRGIEKEVEFLTTLNTENIPLGGREGELVTK